MAAKESLSNSETEIFARWGLGRGIDITNSSPWIEKTSFQVRSVNWGELIETDHGGLLKAFSEEVRSKTTVINEVQCGIKAPNTPLTVRMDAEHTRSTLSNKYVVGTKIRKRTVAFKLDFSDVPQSRVTSVEEAREEIVATRKVSDAKSQPHASPSIAEEGEDMCRLLVGRPNQRSPPPSSSIQGEIVRENSILAMHQLGLVTREVSSAAEAVQFDEGGLFEERLCKWLKDCLQHRGYSLRQDEQMRDLIQAKSSEKDCDLLLQIERYLDHFVDTFGVTHYVSAIELGAMSYYEVSGKEFVQHANLIGKSSVLAAEYGGVEASITHKISNSKIKESFQQKKIGKMEMEKVTEEAVIACQFVPISCLVKMPYLKQALKNITEKYTKARCRSKGGGQYYVTFGDDLGVLYYLTVDHDNSRQLTTTTNMEDAETFTVKVFSECSSHHQFEFSLTSTFPKYREKMKQVLPMDGDSQEVSHNDLEWQDLNSSTSTSLCTPLSNYGRKILPLEYYLETLVNPLGKGRFTPRMRINSKSKHVRLMLKNRTNHKISCGTKQWLKGREAYYIQCIHRLHSGYLCAKKVTHGCRQYYEVCVKPSVDTHSDNGEVFMIFQLKPDLQA